MKKIIFLIIIMVGVYFGYTKFVKDKIYHYRFDPADAARVLVTTEEGTEQDLWYTEFDILFTLVKN